MKHPEVDVFKSGNPQAPFYQQALQDSTRFREAYKKRKKHNQATRTRIGGLVKRKAKLHLEKKAKLRILSGPHSHLRDDKIKDEYARRVKQIERNLLKVDKEIESLKNSIIRRERH